MNPMRPTIDPASPRQKGLCGDQRRSSSPYSSIGQLPQLSAEQTPAPAPPMAPWRSRRLATEQPSTCRLPVDLSARRLEEEDSHFGLVAVVWPI